MRPGHTLTRVGVPRLGKCLGNRRERAGTVGGHGVTLWGRNERDGTAPERLGRGASSFIRAFFCLYRGPPNEVREFCSGEAENSLGRVV